MTTLLDTLTHRYVTGLMEVDEYEAEVGAVLAMQDESYQFPVRVFKTFWGAWAWSVCTGQGLATGYASTEYTAWREARSIAAGSGVE